MTHSISFQLLSSPNNFWWKGLPWLTPPSAWPQWQPEPTIQLHAAAAIAQEFIPQPTIPTVSGLNMIINLSDYSTFNRLLAVTAYTYRHISNLHKSRQKASCSVGDRFTMLHLVSWPGFVICCLQITIYLFIYLFIYCFTAFNHTYCLQHAYNMYVLLSHAGVGSTLTAL